MGGITVVSEASPRRGLPVCDGQAIRSGRGQAGIWIRAYACDDAGDAGGWRRRKQQLRGAVQGWHARCSQHISNADNRQRLRAVHRLDSIPRYLISLPTSVPHALLCTTVRIRDNALWLHCHTTCTRTYTVGTALIRLPKEQNGLLPKDLYLLCCT